MSVDVRDIRDKVAEQSEHIEKIRFEVGKAIVGQKHLVDRLLIALLADGHVLLEGVPGLAKTTAIKALAQALDTGFHRIQFTPDLLPADLIGTLIYNPREGTFSTKKGPVFSNLILADEINRAPSKVQSALLEAMQERQVTIGEETHPLPDPFLVLATQNPIEQEGTYPLPEAQVDRFMLKVLVDYPSPAEEIEIVDLILNRVQADIKPVVTGKEVRAMRDVVGQIYIDEKVKGYIVALVHATRRPGDVKGLEDIAHLIDYGASPRASICLAQGARTWAFLQTRGFVTPQDVKDVAYDVLRHRVILSYEAEAEETTAEDIIRTLLESVPVP